ncbi:MAG: S8 family serine peptidase [Verrucomicrobia bacterium]|nr:S8 family serine peptidase [Verrucomicrobiota bacterium]
MINIISKVTGLVLTFGFLLGAEANAVSFQVYQPQPVCYELLPSTAPLRASATSGTWLRVRSSDQRDGAVYLGDRVALRLRDSSVLSTLLVTHGLQVSRKLDAQTFVLQALDAQSALEAAASLGQFPGVLASYPVIRRSYARRSAYAPLPNDPYFDQQWSLDQRNTNGVALGIDLNVRAAWPISQGAGVVVAIGDEGVQLDHPDLSAPAMHQPHFNFYTKLANGYPNDQPLPIPPLANHGTAVAGLAVARGGNQIGIAGVAPQAGLASWVILGSDTLSDEDFMDMYQFQSNVVSVQNHSWGTEGFAQAPLSTLEDLGIENAFTRGRQGRGVVIVRAGGNDKGGTSNSNDEAAISDPRVIAVAAVRQDGRVTSYSTRGASLLVAAPSGDPSGGYSNVISTDRTGAKGYNSTISPVDDSADYVFGNAGFNGTSASSPQIAGVVALILGTNPLLTVRDVQQILILSARHSDLADPDLRTNGAGFRVSHNVGFGVPDAGQAVRIAQSWSNRPPQVILTQTNKKILQIPEKPLVEIKGVTGQQFPSAVSSLGPEAERDIGFLSLIDIGRADGVYTGDLHGKAAFIQRGGNYFYEKIENAARLGAEMAIIYNNRDATAVFTMGLTDFTSIPAVFIGQEDGEEIGRELSTSNGYFVKARFNGANAENSANYSFDMTTPLLLEHVRVSVDSDHPRRGDLRITLISPAGTSSLLQFKNTDNTAGPIGWTYTSTHHFFESSLGIWKVRVQDQRASDNGSVMGVTLEWRGTAIQDSDRDGLDDNWERTHLSTLKYGPGDDPDRDGVNTMREFLMGTNPMTEDVAFRLEVAPLDASRLRLSWPSTPGDTYEVWGYTDVQTQPNLVATVKARSTETEWINNPDAKTLRFFRIKRNQSP